jgi:hypothetical protein
VVVRTCALRESRPRDSGSPTRTTPARRIVAAPRRWDIARMPATTFIYVETDVPEGMSLDSWRRRGNATAEPASRLARLWRALGAR